MNSIFQNYQDIRPVGGFTVLMAVYHKDDPLLFNGALKSVFQNTLSPDEVLVVCDGPLTAELDEVLALYQVQESNLNTIRLSQNLGLSNALNEGLKHINTVWVVRADSDDLNRLDRFSRQAEALCKANGELDIFGSAIQEIDKDGTQLAIRRTASGNEAIRKFAARRNPFNHMTVWYRTELARRVGGYPDIYLKEDYGLWASMLFAGARCDNLPEITVDAVTGKEMYRRRGGIKYALAEIRLQQHLYRCEMKSKIKSCIDGAARASVFLMPAFLRSIIYKNILRKREGHYLN